MVIVSNNVDLLAKVVNNSNFGKAEEYRFYEPWLGQSSIITSGLRWKKLRKIITPAYHSQILESSMSTFKEEANILVSKLIESNGQCVDITNFIAFYALDVITQATMGVKINSQTQSTSDIHKNYIQASSEILRVIDQRILNPLCYFDWLWYLNSGFKKQNYLIKTLHQFVNNLIKSRRANLSVFQEKDNKSTEKVSLNKRKVLLDILLNATIDEKPLTDHDILGEVNTATFAGHSSTTITVSFFLYCLAQYPDVQQRVFNEVQTCLNEDNDITIGAVNKLRYMDMAIKESMRIYTLAPIVGRRGTNSLDFDGKKVPADTTIYFLVNSIHMDPKYFPQPDKYDPDRFLADRNPYTYIPFSAGLRICAGQKFAMLSMKLLTISVLRQFEVKLGYEGFKPKVYCEEFLKSANGIQLKFVPRLNQDENK